MKKLILPIVFSVFLFQDGLFAQVEKVDTAMMRKIREEETNHSQLASIAHNLTDVCGPRLTNSPGYRAAIKWVTQTFKGWELQNAGPEAWGEFGRGWSTENASLAMRKPYYENMIAYPSAWTKSTSGRISAAVQLIDSYDSASIAKLGDSVKGKIIMRRPNMLTIKSPFDTFATRYPDTVLDKLPDDYMVRRTEIDSFLPMVKSQYQAKLSLEARGAVALISSSPELRDGTVAAQGGPGYKKGYKATMPEMLVTREDYLKLARLLNDKKQVQLEIDVQNKFYDDDLTGYNVVGEIAGTDPLLKNQVVMLGGHLDSWHAGTGATDNAAGCAVMMEALRLLKTLGVHPRRTIRIVLWGGEEQGPYGSFGYVKKHYGDPIDMKLTAEQKNVSAYFNLDNGSGKIRGIYLQNNEKVRDIFSAWLAPFADLGAAHITSSNTGSTDHLSFDAVGIPGFEFIQDPLEYETRTHHTNMDTYEHLSIDDLKQASIIVAAFVYNTAMRDEMLPRKPLPKPERFVFDTDFPF
jgi:carboxypeptidase Q